MVAFKLRHKIVAAVACPEVAHHAYTLSKEHLFLIVHDMVSHAGWLVYTACGAIALLVPAYLYLKKSGASVKED